MKKLLFFACTVCFAVACNNKEGNSSGSGPDSTKSSADAKLDYPYTLDHPYNDWQPGDQKYAVDIMKSLKAWENGNIAEAVSYFGDSVDLRFDYYHKKVSHDTLTSVFTQSRNGYSSLKIKMDDWESVISKDGKTQWVTLWYKETFTDKKGKTDSIGVVNDIKVENGKFVVLDEKIQHFPPAPGGK